MAARLRGQWPALPLALVGFSFGGFIQFPVARRLAEAGPAASQLVVAGPGVGEVPGRTQLYARRRAGRHAAYPRRGRRARAAGQRAGVGTAAGPAGGGGHQSRRSIRLAAGTAPPGPAANAEPATLSLPPSPWVRAAARSWPSRRPHRQCRRSRCVRTRSHVPG
ncbi:hypothetical protein [Cupriavidus pinatubonensis]|uniref:hypothetical protein n=1 Tax=Cupriavidus pinatubonensis TaxID=248026 RepID=UPI0037BE830E